MSPDDRWRLTHVVEALEAAAKFSEGRSRADLDTDQMPLFALTRAIEIVGEASSKVSAAGRKGLPTVPWAQLVGMRNRLYTRVLRYQSQRVVVHGHRGNAVASHPGERIAERMSESNPS